MARSLSLALLAGAIALGAALASAVARDGATATVEVTVWRSVAEPSRLWLSTRAQGGRWRTESAPLALSAPDEAGRFHRGNAIAVAVTLADGGAATVEAAVWRSAAEPSRLYVATRAEGGHWRTEAEPLDMSARSASGRFHRSAIVAVRVPFPSIVPQPDPELVEACSNGVAVPEPEANPGLVNDCAILLEAHDTLVGEGDPLGWSADKPVGPSWRGVTVEGTPPRVTRVWLAGYGIDLRGQLPPVLAGLSHLRELWIRSALTGPIPPQFGQLRNLRDLSLYGNLTGTIPPELGSLSLLEELELVGNRLTGAIPPELGQLANLETLRLDGNQLSGGIPPELGALPQLDWLWLDGNQLTGPIPPELALLPDLQELDLKNNQLTGAIPREFASFADLDELDLRNNQLTGQIPAKLSASPYFNRLWLGGNQFTGCLPLDLRRIVLDRGALGLRFCQCPSSLLPDERDSSALTHGADGIPFLPGGYYGYTAVAGTYRISYSLVVDLPEGGMYKLWERWRTDDGDIRTRIREEASQSYLVIDPFTGEEHGRVVVDGPAGCAANPSVLLDRIATSARAQPLDIPPDPDGARPLPFREPVTGDGGSWRVAVGGGPRDRAQSGRSLVFDAPEGMILTHERTGGEINGDFTFLVDLRDEASGSRITFSASTNSHTSIGAELWRNVTEAGEARGVGALFDRIAASAREGPPPSCDMPAIAPDCAVLLDAKATLAGEAVLNWSRDVPLEDWDGIVVDRRTVRIAWLDLPEAGLTGRIPPSLGGLSRLEVLVLNGNRLTGPIPPEIADIPGLRTLHLEHNRLSGAIPPQLAAVPDLWLDLSGNRLEGCIPAGLDDIGEYGEPDSNPGLFRCDGSGPPTCARPETAPDCAVLLEARDTLAGTATLNWSADIPLAEWQGVTVDGETGRVTGLELQRTSLTGSIPPVLGQLTGLERLWLYDNHLEGEIPPALGTLANLQGLFLSDNQITGKIPPELGQLTNLRQLSLYDNRLRGEIPPALGTLIKLWDLHLSGNQLTGRIPPELGQITNLRQLWLYGNHLEGEIPPALASLTNLRGLLLSDNQLTGNIPPDLGKMTSLESLWVVRNRLDGTIPSEIGALTNLRSLLLFGNQLTGEIPPVLGQLTALEDLGIGGNRLTGTIPSEIGNLTNLRQLSLFGNQLTGEIPPVLGQLTALVSLRLQGNRLMGTIPSTLGKLAGLEVLELHDNQLEGAIPAEFGALTNLRDLYLSGNRLTGLIPPGLASLPKLEALQIHGNRLAGCVPDGLLRFPLSLGWANSNPLLSRCDGSGPSTCARPETAPDCAVLLEARDTLIGDGDDPPWGPRWSANEAWSAAVPLADWRGVTVDQRTGRVVALNMAEMNLRGRIPPALVGLDALEGLALHGNELAGTIPPELGTLANLRYLHLHGNQLEGGIPSTLGALANLRDLRLSGNWLTGIIPPELGQLTGLEQLWLHDNRLTGPIPPAIGELRNLRALDLSGNRLTGSIPPGIARIPRLAFLRLQSNQLNGPIPPALGQLAYLQEVQLDHNDLTGEIPPSLAETPYLRRLDLGGNQLDGCVPAGLERFNILAHDGNPALRRCGGAR